LNQPTASEKYRVKNFSHGTVPLDHLRLIFIFEDPYLRLRTSWRAVKTQISIVARYDSNDVPHSVIPPHLQVFAAIVYSLFLFLISQLVRDEPTYFLLDTKLIVQNRFKAAAANPCFMP
jgi:hypothetical protein